MPQLVCALGHPCRRGGATRRSVSLEASIAGKAATSQELLRIIAYTCVKSIGGLLMKPARNATLRRDAMPNTNIITLSLN